MDDKKFRRICGDESSKLHKGFIFWVCNFHEFFGSEFAWYLFFKGIMTNVWAESPYHQGGPKPLVTSQSPKKVSIQIVLHQRL